MHVFDPFLEWVLKVIRIHLFLQDFPVADAGLGALAYSLEAIMAAKEVCVVGIHALGRALFQPSCGTMGFMRLFWLCRSSIVGAWCGICILIAYLYVNYIGSL